MLDYLNPDYTVVYRERAERLKRLNTMTAREFASLKAYYRDGRIADFISQWGMTFNPKNVGTPIPVVMPFVLFPMQRDWLDYVYRKWTTKEPGLTEKSRDIGISWLAMAFSVTACLLNKNMDIGFGSAKEENVDSAGDPNCLFHKGRMFIRGLPVRFTGGWDVANKAHSSHRKLLFPATESTIVGASGDNIGRGGRTSIFFVDESCHIERPHLIDASLSANTDCRMDMSSVKGMANSFAEKRFSGNVEVFTFSWRSDPRRTDEWAEKKRKEVGPVVWAAEYEMNYSASVEGVIIPSEWITAAIGLHTKLGVKPTGVRLGAMDVADVGQDMCALATRHGSLLTSIREWSGKGGDLLESTGIAFRLCDDNLAREMLYDADGMGASMKGFARALNAERTKPGIGGRAVSRAITVVPFVNGGAPLFPERIVPKTERKNEDYYQNRKAQAWHALRLRFENAYYASQGREYDPDNIIYIDRDLPNLTKVQAELSQPVWKPTTTGKLQVDKTPDGMKSPNLADAVMMVFSPRRTELHISDELLGKV